MYTVTIVSLAIIGIIVAAIFFFRKKYHYYTIEVWTEVPEAGTAEMIPFPETERGPNLRQSIKTKKWEIGKEAYSLFTDRHYYIWLSLDENLGNELLRKILRGETVQVWLKENNEAIISA